MAAFLPTGTIFSLAQTYAAVTPITTLSNGAPPVAGAVANSLSNGDVGVLASGWLDLNDRPARVIGKVTDAFNLEGYDATDTTRYPPGNGVGSFQKVATWMQLSQTLTINSSGGEQNYVTYKYIEDGRERKKPTYKGAKSLDLTFADDPTLPWYPVMMAADRASTPRILRAALPGGGFIYYNTYVSFDAEPTLNADNINTVKASFQQVGPLIRYLT